MFLKVDVDELKVKKYEPFQLFPNYYILPTLLLGDIVDTVELYCFVQFIIFSFLTFPNNGFCASLQDIAEKFNITAMPTFVFLKGGVEVHRILGADKVKLGKAVLELSAPAATTSAAEVSAA